MIITRKKYFESVCQKKLLEWYSTYGEEKIDPVDVFVVWSCKTLQNYRFLLKLAEIIFMLSTPSIVTNQNYMRMYITTTKKSKNKEENYYGK